ncbi:phage tail tape measure protein, partial [Mycobacteroides abscessus subsp. massiliense]
AEITDVAQALQSGGAVANQFGLKLEDTAAAIGLLANNGIKGSDAGTLLKSALLALTDTSNPAQGAIEELGLTVYDAQGRFVGLEKLFGDLQAASQRMTPEMYQAATTTLFGSDAARLAGIAAKDGAAGYDQMRDAMEKQGSAAKLAAAQNQGLPGVIERLKNAAETLAITLFEKVQGPLSSIGDGLTGFTNKMQ